MDAQLIRLSRWLPAARLGAVFAFFLLLISSQAQPASPWRIFKAADGLPESFSASVTLSPFGNLWATHGEGNPNSRLDGYQVSAWPAPPDQTSKVYENQWGQLWSLYRGGIAEFRNGAWILHPVRAIQQEQMTNLFRRVRPISILPGEQDCLLFLLPDRLLEFNAVSNRIHLLWTAEEAGLGSFTDMAEEKSGGIWIAGVEGLARLPGPVRRWPAPVPAEIITPDLGLNLRNFQQPYPDEDGGVVTVAESVNQAERVVAYYAGGEWQTWSFPGTKLRRGWRSPDGTVWGLSIDALFRLDPGQRQPEREPLPAGQFFDVVLEKRGVFWLATSEGLIRYAPLPWRTPPEVGGHSPVIHAILEDADRRLWFAGSRFLFQLSEQQWTSTHYPAELELGFQPTDGLYAMPDGRIAVASIDRVLIFNPVTSRFAALDHSPGTRLKLIGQAPTGLLWIQVVENRSGTNSVTLQSFDGRRFSPVFGQLPLGRLGQELYFCHKASNGDIWLGGTLGIARWRDGKLQTFSQADGDPPDSAFCWLEFPNGKIWCGGLHKIYEFDGVVWKIVLSELERINALSRAPDGTIWVATSDGLFRLEHETWIAHGLEEGLPSSVCYEVFRDRKGHLWAGTSRGLSLYHPLADTDPPKTRIVSANDLNEFVLDSPISVVFLGMDKWKFTLADRLLYSHRVDAGKWSPFTANNSLNFRELSPGNHRLETRAMDRNGNVDPKPALFEYSVILPWYMETRILIVLFCGLAAVLVMGGVAVNRHLRLVHSYGEVEQIVAQRTQQLEQAHQALLQSEKMRALGTLAAGLSHDFNNILSIIRGSAQIIEANLRDEEKIRARVGRIKMVVDQGAGLIKALLTFGKSSTRHKEMCQVNPMVEETVRLLGDKFLQDITLEWELAADLPSAPAVPDFVRQSLLNLILNASDAMSGHGVITLRTGRWPHLPPDLDLSPGQASDYVYIQIQDQGTGIPQEIRSRIFEPFFTTKAFSSRRGTGLGLTMVYELAKNQGHGIQILSEKGHGTRFTLILPVNPIPPEPWNEME